MSESIDDRQRGNREGRVEALRMRPEFRGPVEPLDDRGQNEHLALIYESQEQQFTAVVPFIEQGLERGEQCLYIADETERAAVLDALQTASIDVDSALEDGRLVVRSISDTHQQNGRFDPDEMLTFYTEAIEDAVMEHEALRVTAETAWVAADDTAVADVMEYEQRVNELFHDTASIALCQYDRNRFSDAVIHDVIRTHPHIVYEQTISQNVFYMPSARGLDCDRDMTVDRMLDTLLALSETILDCYERGDFLRELTKISCRLDRSFEEIVQDLFRLGCEQFGHELGVMAYVDPKTGRFEIEHTSVDHDYFTPGSTLPLSETACRAAIEGGTVAELLFTENGCDGVTVIEEFGLQAALGTYVEIDRGADRLLFFVAAQPRAESVSNTERRFHAVLGHLVKAELEHRQQQLVEEDIQFNRLMRELMQALTAESTRSEIEHTVCERIATSSQYEAAWIGDRPLTDQRITLTAWAGIQEEAVQSVVDADAGHDAMLFPIRAIKADEPAVIRVTDDKPVGDPFIEHLREQGMQSAMAIPLVYHDTCYGVLVVYAERAEAFTDQYRSVLSACGTWIGFAIAATERKEALVTNDVVELDVKVRDSDHFFFSVTDEVDVSFTLEGIIAQSNGSYLIYVVATGGPVDAVFDHADQAADIDHARLVADRGDEGLLEFIFAGPTVVETFAECGGTVTAATAEDGKGTVTVELPQTTDIRTVVETFQTTFPDSEVVAKRSRDRSGMTDRGFRYDFSDRLTEKQHEVLRAAFFAGYFNRPRRTTGDELAETLDISPSTFHQHLQVGLQKLLTAAFDDQTTQ